MVERLPYSDDSCQIYERLRGYKMPVFLDSASPYSKQGRYDILSAEPFHVLKRGNAVSRNILNQNRKDDFFEEVKKAIQLYFPKMEKSEYPFSGGAVGYFGYDLGREIESLSYTPGKVASLPDGLVGLYSWGIIVDHDKKKTTLVAQPFADSELIKEVKRKISCAPWSTALNFHLNTPFCSNFSKAQYTDAYNRIQRYINGGDCYQINLSQCFSAKYEGDPWQGYLMLRRAAAAPFSAYMELEDGAVLCVSPERFLECRPPAVVTSPIKGTIKRGKSKLEDQRLANTLATSEKDRAENLMIVDLMRNDMGRCCEVGSIKVDILFELQSFETVHHLVSTISGKLKEDLHCFDLLATCFPGGSITGAPKIKAMEIIDELEGHRRSIYCGSVGYISCDGGMDTNIAIRTMVCHDDTISCWTGGGIVSDSTCESEYEECMDKVEKLFIALEGTKESVS